MSFGGGFGSGTFGSNNNNQGSGFGFGANNNNNNTTGGTYTLLHSVLITFSRAILDDATCASPVRTDRV